MVEKINASRVLKALPEERRPLGRPRCILDEIITRQATYV
jgi:hypothetical protein